LVGAKLVQRTERTSAMYRVKWLLLINLQTNASASIQIRQIMTVRQTGL
jgi:hypothetical protein